MFKFECKIHKKPRGNWRPRVDINIFIPADSYPHRPHIKGIRLIYDCNRCVSCSHGRRKIIDKKEIDILLPPNTGIYDSPLHGEGHRAGEYICENEYGYGVLTLIFDRYLSKDISINKTFYLPWRPGSKPDYSDFAEAFAQIPLLLEKQLEDGLDSGESDEILITESVIHYHQRPQNANEDIIKEKPTRKLKL